MLASEGASHHLTEKRRVTPREARSQELRLKRR